MSEKEARLLRRRSISIGLRDWGGFTPDLLAKARHRVLFIAWLMLGVGCVGSIVSILYSAFVLHRPDPVWICIGLVPLALALGLLVAARNQRLEHLTVLHIALVYEVLFCVAAAVPSIWFSYQETGHPPGLTWVAPIIILFPLIVPSPPRVALFVSVVAASMQPLTIAMVAGITGLETDPIHLLLSCVSLAIAIIMAYAGSRVVHGISVNLATADRMGSYRLGDRLGTGGMGEVWRAEHELLARPAAIKLIRPESLTENATQQHVILSRFEREAQATAAMQSPHTIDIYDFGIAQSGAFYYVMELLRGLDLEDLVDRFGAVQPSRLVYLMQQICDSLGEAHENGLIHRDVKPANVYVCRYNRQVDFVKVLDFGLVKLEQDEGEDAHRLTIDGAAVGTPGFVAPEQVLGHHPDGRTDIYALGCTAYWALTGSYVFKAETGMGTMMMHVNTPPQPPSSIGPRTIPSDLEELILACLEKDPVNRPQNVDEVSKTLAACDFGEPWTQDMARAWWESNLPAATRAEFRWTGTLPTVEGPVSARDPRLVTAQTGG